ncbi:hypothetical protein [Arthrobacter sp. NPDC056727]|uniref:hypothetical protein n=1 Tax=Arthrobacter sp. NPDC056727 TaxID=3345927 RepID=UPI00366B7174
MEEPSGPVSSFSIPGTPQPIMLPAKRPTAAKRRWKIVSMETDQGPLQLAASETALRFLEPEDGRFRPSTLDPDGPDISEAHCEFHGESTHASILARVRDGGFDVVEHSQILGVRLATFDKEGLHHVHQIDSADRVRVGADGEGAGVPGASRFVNAMLSSPASSTTGLLAAICQSSCSRPRKVEYLGSTSDHGGRRGGVRLPGASSTKPGSNSTRIPHGAERNRVPPSSVTSQNPFPK